MEEFIKGFWDVINSEVLGNMAAIGVVFGSVALIMFIPTYITVEKPFTKKDA